MRLADFRSKEMCIIVASGGRDCALLFQKIDTREYEYERFSSLSIELFSSFLGGFEHQSTRYQVFEVIHTYNIYRLPSSSKTWIANFTRS